MGWVIGKYRKEAVGVSRLSKPAQDIKAADIVGSSSVDQTPPQTHIHSS